MVLPATAASAELGAAVRFALDCSRSGVPATTTGWSLLLKAAGARGTEQFNRGAESVDVDRDGPTVTLTPMRNMGARGGFEHRTDAAIRLDDPDDAALGAAMRRAWPGDDDPEAEPELVRDIRLGADWIARALSESGYRADFSPASLTEVDRFFDDSLRRPGKPRRRGLLAEELGVRLFGLGGYIGEVLRRAQGGRWDAEGDDEVGVRLELGDGSVVWPVQRVMKRYELGAEESVAAWGGRARPVLMRVNGLRRWDAKIPWRIDLLWSNLPAWLDATSRRTRPGGGP